MKIFTATRVAALAVGLGLACTQAIAAPQDRNNDRASSNDQSKNDRGDRDNQRNKQKGSKAAPQQGPAAEPVVQTSPRNVERRRTKNRNDNDARRDNGNRRPRNEQVNDRRDRNPALRNDDRRRADVRKYHRNFQAPHRFRVGSYRQPYGYSYRRWNFGQHLPRQYYGQNFWLSNFLVYGLFVPPPGYIWVRYGPDALLIDRYTGEIVQVQYDIFYT